MDLIFSTRSTTHIKSAYSIGQLLTTRDPLAGLALTKNPPLGLAHKHSKSPHPHNHTTTKDKIPLYSVRNLKTNKITYRILYRDRQLEKQKKQKWSAADSSHNSLFFYTYELDMYARVPNATLLLPYLSTLNLYLFSVATLGLTLDDLAQREQIMGFDPCACYI